MSCCGTCLRLLLRLILVGLIFVYGVVPAVLYYYPQIFSHMAFLPALLYPWARYYNDFVYYGLNPDLSHNFQLTNVYSGMRLGMWHMLPESSTVKIYKDVESGKNEVETETDNTEKFQTALKSGEPIVLYLHGNAGSRCSYHRVQLYKRMISSRFQVVAVDYRGYADSEGKPDEPGVSNDARFVFESIVRLTESSHKPLAGESVKIAHKVIVWGHSLGTGITLRFLAELAESGGPLPNGIILESPFSDMRSTLSKHPLSAPYRNTPILELMTRAMNHSGLQFESMNNLQRLCAVAPNIRVLILHAEDDPVIPLSEARALYDAALRGGCKSIRLVEFPAERRYRHVWITLAPELPSFLVEALRNDDD